ncbi:MAG: hypothetical protein K0R93_3796 [Anaerosolibacter sp.]|jgi:diamine N-acetyltransferase|uniref:GNAT family N-acetyltransferase n=1 Tax=Anaerosolibacter sp. TaxID=1872527 RepID=UPI00262EDED3|nr:GNAT family N-acetyltransferase [Anaerosolibacter sp.]MDF2548898.1 hypothetical protein [Anaerosolibacter sp.]
MNQVALRFAEPNEKRKIYEWLALSDVTSQMFDDDNPPETWENFNRDESDFLFDHSAPELGGYLIITLGGEEMGAISYACFHLIDKVAELDIWMRSFKYCGLGYGVDALNQLIDKLHREQGIKEFIIRPSKENVAAIRAYKKCGFTLFEDFDPRNYVKEEFYDMYGDGDYGLGGDITLIRRYNI